MLPSGAQGFGRQVIFVESSPLETVPPIRILLRFVEQRRQLVVVFSDSFLPKRRERGNIWLAAIFPTRLHRFYVCQTDGHGQYSVDQVMSPA